MVTTNNSGTVMVHNLELQQTKRININEFDKFISEGWLKGAKYSWEGKPTKNASKKKIYHPETFEHRNINETEWAHFQNLGYVEGMCLTSMFHPETGQMIRVTPDKITLKMEEGFQIGRKLVKKVEKSEKEILKKYINIKHLTLGVVKRVSEEQFKVFTNYDNNWVEA